VSPILYKVVCYQRLADGPRVALVKSKMLRIRRSEDKGLATFSVSGRIEEKHVSELLGLFHAEANEAGITLDLGEVTLADRETVRFLAACEVRGITLMNCPPYIREWIEAGRDTSHES